MRPRRLDALAAALALSALAAGCKPETPRGRNTSSCSSARPAASAAGPAEFELRGASAPADVTEGQPITITTPKGEKIEVVICRKEQQRYADHGVAFQYPRTMTVTAEEETGFATIKAESSKSPLVLIQVYSVPASPEELRKTLIESLEAEFRARQAQVSTSKAPVSRTIAGQPRDGVALEFTLAGEAMRAEVFAFTKGASPIAFVFQAMKSESELAESEFGVIASTFQ